MDTFIGTTKTLLLSAMTQKIANFTKNKDKTVFSQFLVGADNSRTILWTISEHFIGK